MKKSRNKLISTVMLILVSATIVGTASYAWFTMNDRVNAGMDIEAVAAKNLVISETSGGYYTTAVSLSDTGVTKVLNPALIFDLVDWFVLEGDEGISYDTGEISEDTPFLQLSLDDLTGYVRVGTVYVKSDMADSDDSFSKVYVSKITVNRGDEESEITKALRIGVVCGDNTLVFDYDSLNTYLKTKVIESVDDETRAPTLADLECNVVGPTAVVAENVGTAPVKVEIYLWYEGQDEACISHNSIKVENVEVIVEFQGIR